MYDLESVRRSTGKYLLILLWAHVLVVPVIAYLAGGEWNLIAVAAALVALVATFTRVLCKETLAYCLVYAVALMGMASLVVFALRGHPWQADAHMYYFAALALLAGYCDWRVIATAGSAIALHHLFLNFAFPDAVYPAAAICARRLACLYTWRWRSALDMANE